MRNLKRALSLLLSSTMVLGMLVMGSSAQSFTDAEDISNVEAVTIVDGLDVMNGYPDGSFKPEGIVTRAEMAVVISKMLYGPEFNPANFEGAGTFTDTPDWAEGYINLCASLDIIAGRGNGIFDPNATVTTSEAAAMFLRTLGYLQTSEEFGTDWQLAVTSKATNLGLYGDLKLSINEGLSRENVAEMAFNTLFAQRVAYDDYRGLYVKANDRNVVVTNGTEDENNTLAQNTFGLYVAEGVVTANGQTDKKLSASLKSEAQTEVMFTEDTDLNKDGKAEYEEGDTYDFEVETGLDMIGHAASVYYKMENKSPVVYAIVDDATLVSYVDYNSNTTKLAEAANDAGFKKNSILDVATKDYILNYDMDTTLAKADEDGVNWANGSSIDEDVVANGKTLVVISNSGNMNVDYVIVLDQYLDTIDQVEKDDDQTTYALKDTTDGSDMNVALTSLVEDDFVVVTDIGNQGEVKALAAATVETATITKLIGVTNASTDVTTVVADGQNYTESEVLGSKVKKDFTLFADISTIGSATLVLDQFGKLIGLASEPAAPNYAYVAQFGQRHSTTGLNTDTDVWTALVYFNDGTSGIYEIDTDRSAIMAENGGDLGNAYYKDAATANGADKASVYRDAASRLKGLYNVKVLSNGKVDIDYITTDVSSAASADGATVYTSHSSIVSNAAGLNYNSNAATGTAADDVIYQSNDTIYFFVTGAYNDYNGENTLRVNVVTGVSNVDKFTNDIDANDTTLSQANTLGVGIREAYADVVTGGKDIVTAVLVQGIRTEDDHVYYYDEGNYEIDPVDGGYSLTYILYDATTGEKTSATYDNNGKPFESVSDAKDVADVKAEGFYTIGATDLKVKTTVTDDKADLGKDTVYVVNDKAVYDEILDNLFSSDVTIGSIMNNTTFVDLTNNGLDSAKKIANIITAGDGDIYLSYVVDKNLNSKIVFVTYYDPDATEAPGGNTNNAKVDSNTLDSTDAGELTATVKLTENVSGYASFQLQYSTDNGKTWHSTGTPVQAPFSYDTATYTYTNVTSSTGGLVYRVLVNDVKGLVTSADGTAVTIIDDASNSSLCK